MKFPRPIRRVRSFIEYVATEYRRVWNFFTALAGSIDALTGKTALLYGELASLQSEVTAHTAEIADLKARVEKLAVEWHTELTNVRTAVNGVAHTATLNLEHALGNRPDGVRIPPQRSES